MIILISSWSLKMHSSFRQIHSICNKFEQIFFIYNISCNKFTCMHNQKNVASVWVCMVRFLCIPLKLKINSLYFQKYKPCNGNVIYFIFTNVSYLNYTKRFIKGKSYSVSSKLAKQRWQVYWYLRSASR